VTVVDDLLVAHLGDPAGPVAPVRHGFEWGIFLDGPTVEALLKKRIPQSLPPLQSVNPIVRWSPRGAQPFLHAQIEGPIKVPDPFTCRVTASLDCAVSLAGPAPALRIDVSYDVSVDTGALEPVLSTGVQVAVELVKRDLVNPAAFGAERTGPQSFALTLPLPEIRIAGEPWRYEGMVADGPGLVLGGSAALPLDLSQVVLHTTTNGFAGLGSGTVALLFCSRNDEETDVPLARFFHTVAVVEYDGGGTLCDVEVVPAGADLEAHLTLPKADWAAGGARPGNGKIFMAFDPISANNVTGRIQLIVQTTRGVRCCDLGQPEHFNINEDGTIMGGLVIYIDDCNRLPPNFGEMTPEEYERWSGIIWYTYWGLVPGRDYDPERPPILPDTLADIPPQWDEAEVVVAPTGSDGGDELTVSVPDQFRVTRAAPAPQLDISTDSFEE
jgi:hypothetical protein